FARAQEDYDDSDDDDTDHPGSASLYLNFDPLGGAKTTFTLPERPANWNEILRALSDALHCPGQNFAAPSLSERIRQMMNRWPADRRERYLQYFAGYQNRQSIATCGSVVSWNKFGRSGSFDFSGVSAQLKQAGIRDFWITISYPKTKSVEYSR